MSPSYSIRRAGKGSQSTFVFTHPQFSSKRFFAQVVGGGGGGTNSNPPIPLGGISDVCKSCRPLCPPEGATPKAARPLPCRRPAARYREGGRGCIRLRGMGWGPEASESEGHGPGATDPSHGLHHTSHHSEPRIGRTDKVATCKEFFVRARECKRSGPGGEGSHPPPPTMEPPPPLPRSIWLGPGATVGRTSTRATRRATRATRPRGPTTRTAPPAAARPSSTDLRPPPADPSRPAAARGGMWWGAALSMNGTATLVNPTPVVSLPCITSFFLILCVIGPNPFCTPHRKGSQTAPHQRPAGMLSPLKDGLSRWTPPSPMSRPCPPPRHPPPSPPGPRVAGVGRPVPQSIPLAGARTLCTVSCEAPRLLPGPLGRGGFNGWCPRDVWVPQSPARSGMGLLSVFQGDGSQRHEMIIK